MRKTSDAVRAAAVSRRGAGEPLRAIAADLGMSVSAVKAWCAAAGVVVAAEVRHQNARAGQAPGHMARIRGMLTPEVLARRQASQVRAYKNPALRQLKGRQSSEWWAGLSVEDRAAESARRSGESSGRARSALGHHPDTAARYRAAAEGLGGKYLGPETYVGTHERTDWECGGGHQFAAPPYTVLAGHWCGRCAVKTSRAESEVFAFVSSHCQDARASCRDLIPPQEIDIYTPSARLGIEYHGLYWHGESVAPERRFRTRDKHVAAEAAGLRLVTLFEDEWMHRRPAVEGYLSALLGRRARVGARACEVVDGDLRSFVETHHLQGGAGGVHYGLRHHGELVAVATFAAPNASRARRGGAGVWELARYCVGPVGVSGGLSRLISAFRAQHQPASLISYSDNRWSAGGLYRAAGFALIRHNRPSYWYFRPGYCERIHRYTLRKQVLLKRFGGDPGQTEWQLAQAAGYDRIWDAGTTLWQLDFSPKIC